MAKVTCLLDIQIDPTRPVEELNQVISAVLAYSPLENQKQILEGLDLEIGNALARLEKDQVSATESESADKEEK
ncbi:hypothetical protein D3C74_302680 [compost metagenome]